MSSAQASRVCTDAPATGNGDLSFGFSAKTAEEVPDWTYRINNQWILNERSKALLGVDLQWTASSDSLLW